MGNPDMSQENKKDRVKIRHLAVWPWILWGSLLTFGVFGSAVWWSFTTEIEGAVVATGRITVEGRPKTVQHLDGGIVEAIFVRDGDKVSAGDVLIRLDDEGARANLAIVSRQLDELMAEEARLLTERDGSESITFPEEMVRRQSTSPDLKRIMRSQAALLSARRSAIRGKKHILAQKIAAIQGQIEGLKEEKDGKSKQIALLEQEIATVTELVTQGQARMPRLLSLQREKARLLGERGRITGAIAQAEKSIEEIRLEILQIDNKVRETVISRLREVQAKLAELREKRALLKDKLKRILIRAPVSGRVHNMAIHTVGGVIAPGKPILQIIPESDRLIVEARINIADIDQVYEGQTARLYLSAFDRRTTPDLSVKVVEVSPAELEDPRTGKPYYLVEIAIPKSELARLGPERALIPGMPVEVFLRTYPRTFADLVAKLFLGHFRRSFRFG